MSNNSWEKNIYVVIMKDHQKFLNMIFFTWPCKFSVLCLGMFALLSSPSSPSQPPSLSPSPSSTGTTRRPCKLACHLDQPHAHSQVSACHQKVNSIGPLGQEGDGPFMIALDKSIIHFTQRYHTMNRLPSKRLMHVCEGSWEGDNWEAYERSCRGLASVRRDWTAGRGQVFVCLFLNVFVCVFVSLFVCLSVCLFICFLFFVCLFVCCRDLASETELQVVIMIKTLLAGWKVSRMPKTDCMKLAHDIQPLLHWIEILPNFK